MAKRTTSRIPLAEKHAAIADAITSSAPDAAKRWHVSVDSLYHWAEEVGGLQHLRELYKAHQLEALAQLAGSVSRETQKRLPKFNEDQLVTLAVKLLDSERPAPSGVSVAVHNQNANVNLDVSDAEAAYIAALAGQSSHALGPDSGTPAISLSGNGLAGSEPATPDS